MAEKGTVQAIVDWMMGGRGTKDLRTPAAKPPIGGDNTMVKAAADEAAKRARMRGELAPEAGMELAKPMEKKLPPTMR